MREGSCDYCGKSINIVEDELPRCMDCWGKHYAALKPVASPTPPPLTPGQEVWVKAVVESVADTIHVDVVGGGYLYKTLNGECLSVLLSSIHPAPVAAKKGA